MDVINDTNAKKDYTFHLAAFNGPLELLMHLIEKNKIDIYDIPIAELTRQYLDYLEAMREMDMEVTSAFLVMAATLLQIKSRMMLPKKKAEDAVKTEVKQKGQKETELNNSVQQTLSKVKIDGNAIDGNVINKVASIVKSHRQDASNKILTNIRNALVKEYKQEKGNELYKAIKKHIEEYKKEQ